MKLQCFRNWVCLASLSCVTVFSAEFVIGQQSEAANADASLRTAVHSLTEVIGNLSVVRGAESNAFAIFSSERKAWETVKFPDYVEVSICTLDEGGQNAKRALIGFKFTQGRVSELAACNSLGQVSKFALPRSMDRRFIPYLRGNGVLIYIVGGRVYAYSSVTGTWDTIETPRFADLIESEDGTISPPKVSDGFDAESTEGVVLRIENKLFEFQPDIGRWEVRNAPIFN